MERLIGVAPAMMRKNHSSARAVLGQLKSLRTRPDETRMRPAWSHAAWGGFFGLCLTLLIWAPAQWLAWGVSNFSQGQMQWLNPRGTVWSGSAQIVLSGGTGSLEPQGLPGRLQWTLLPSWTGFRLGLLADCCMKERIHLDVQAGISTLKIQSSNHISQWPAALLTGLGAPWNTLKPEGQLQLRTEGLQLHWAEGRMQMRGLAELQIKNISSKLSPTKPIGSYQVELRAPLEGAGIPSLQLTTLQGPLLLSGNGQWIGPRLRFTGEARAEEGHELGLNNLLNILGRRQGSRSLLTLG